VLAPYGRALRGAWREILIVYAVAPFTSTPSSGSSRLSRRSQPCTIFPEEAEPPFLVAQLLTLVAFAVLGVGALLRFDNISRLGRRVSQ